MSEVYRVEVCFLELEVGGVGLMAYDSGLLSGLLGAQVLRAFCVKPLALNPKPYPVHSKPEAP